MGNQDWSNLGDQIKNTVQDAIDSQNFRQLNDSIRNTVNSAMDNVNRSLNQSLNGRVGQQGPNGFDRINNKERNWTRNPNQMPPQNPWDAGRRAYKVAPKSEKNELVSTNVGMKGVGYSLAIMGYLFAGSIGLALFIVNVVGLVGGYHSGLQISNGILTPLFLASLFMGFAGSRILGRLKRFKFYLRQLGNRKFCTLKELSEAAGKPVDYIGRDLKKMIEKNMFRQGHMDSKKTCLMISDEVYDQYRTAEHQMELRQKEEQSRLQESKERNTAQKSAPGKNRENKIPEEVRKVMEEGREYIKKINVCNDAITGREVSEKISRLELITSKILERVESHPENIPDLRKFMEYYLPTTVKLLNAYEELERQPVQGENIISSKMEIEATLDTINSAFEKLLDGFFQDTSWDISADISVLQTMFAQEGLTGQDFKTQFNHSARTDTSKPEDTDEIKLKF